MINIKQTRIPMKKIVRLTESELKGIMRKSVARSLQKVNESIDFNREIKLAQKELHQMGKNLSSIGLRLDGTRYYSLYKKMADAMIELNDALIKEIRKG
jgi:hypothetical protein